MLTIEELHKLIDDFHEVRNLRLRADKSAKSLKSEEQAAEAAIIEVMQQHGLSKMGSADSGTVTLQKKVKPIVKDWPNLYQYILDNKAFDLLHRRLTEAAVEERTGVGENIPGLGTFTVYKLTVSK